MLAAFDDQTAAGAAEVSAQEARVISHHIGIGRTHVLLLAHNLHVRIVHAATGDYSAN